jgi:N-acetylglucosamine-6-phosphate deacetylase
MIVLTGGDLVLPDRILRDGSLLMDRGRIAAVEDGRVDPAGATYVDVVGCYVVPGFIDVHVHGVEGHDTLDGGDAVARIARRLPRYGVTAFCPTTVACAADDLRSFLAGVGLARATRGPGAARVLPAHLESNFINPEYSGAQPRACLRTPPRHSEDPGRSDAGEAGDDWTGRQILDAIDAVGPDVGIVTLAPELPGAIDLVRSLVRAGHLVSLGHSGADFDTAIAAIEAGARHATHLFNRMTPIAHRAPGLAGAVLTRDEVGAELICDAYHVHPAMCRVAMRAKRPHGLMAITDGTAGSGLPVGSVARLGGQAIHVRSQAAFLENGTLAGSTLTMDRAFKTIVTILGAPIVEAAAMCAFTPARQLGLTGFGALEETAVADVVVLDRGFRVVRTFIEGEQVWDRTTITETGV